LQRSNLRGRCQELRQITCPATSPALQEIRYLHHGLLGVPGFFNCVLETFRSDITLSHCMGENIFSA
jgi:hypothetical protein